MFWRVIIVGAVAALLLFAASQLREPSDADSAKCVTLAVGGTGFDASPVGAYRRAAACQSSVTRRAGGVVILLVAVSLPLLMRREQQRRDWADQSSPSAAA